LFLLASQAWALGLGEIRLSSALNEPLRAEIELLAATPEELENLRIQLASAETFERYDLDRPLFLTRLQFEIVRSGRSDGNFVRVTSAEPVTEPFITFLVEAAWSRGRLLREYTLLVDPPTFAPPPTTQATQPVTAPTRQAPADSGEIRRPEPTPEPQPTARPSQAVQPPVQTPSQRPEPAPPVEAEPVAEAPPVRAAPAETPDTAGQPDFDATPGGQVVVARGDTLWGITQRVRPDSRLTINQTMLAIFEANPEAFAGNINVLRAGATLRIPSADDIFRISRRDAFQEVQRQDNEWRGGASLPAPSPAPAPSAEPAETSPSLTLVPPDEEDEPAPTDISIDTGAETVDEPAPVDEVVDPVEERIRELERILENQDALIEIPDTELAALRNELAQLRGEPLPVEEPPVDELQIEDEPQATDEGTMVEQAEPVVQPPVAVVTQRAPEKGLLDKVVGVLTSFWFIIGAALVAAVLVLVWFMRRAGGGDDEDATGVWNALDADELEADSVASTERLSALSVDDDAIVVVETQQMPTIAEEEDGDTVVFRSGESPALQLASNQHAETGTNKSLVDTFSSDSAINLDQSDPVAEADFHMAYGLYDQAADLVTGALEAEPDREDLLAKLCEIYFVWGNRDGFIDAAASFRRVVDVGADPEWDKIVIMGQQIAGDHEMFSGVSAEGMTRAVDLSLDDGSGSADALDIDFASEPGDDARDIFDLKAGNDEVAIDETGQVPIPTDTGMGIDFDLGDDDEFLVGEDEEPELHTASGTALDFDLDVEGLELEASATREMGESDDEGPTVEAPATVDSPSIEEQFLAESTGIIPAISEEKSGLDMLTADSTAEIDLDDLDLDLGGLEETSVGTDIADESALDEFADLGELDDLDAVTEGRAPEDDDAEEREEIGKYPAAEYFDILAASATREMPMSGDALDELDFDSLAETSAAEAVRGTLAETSHDSEIDVDDLEETGSMEALGEDETAMTGLMPALGDQGEGGDVGMDTSLLDATGHTQILSEDSAVRADDDATMLAPGYGDEDVKPAFDDPETLLAPMDDDPDGEFSFARTEALPDDIFSPDMSTDETGNIAGLAGSTDLDLDLDDLTAALKVSEVGDTVNALRDDATIEQPRFSPDDDTDDDLLDARTMTEVGTKLDLARAYVDMGDPEGARSILEEVLEEGEDAQRQQAQKILDSLPS
jgi:pilus assembly protein FimV